MDTITQYHHYIHELLDDISHYRPSYGQVDVETIRDTGRDHYQAVTVGWDGHERIHGTLLHLDIKNGKIWIQYDGTEEGMANRLVARGVPKTNIVLTFHTPSRRKFTDFAIGEPV